MVQTHVVVGAGALGLAVARQLAERGESVRVLSRSGGPEVVAGVERVRVDAADSESLMGHLRGAAVVYQCSQPPYIDWVRDFPPLQRAIVDATSKVGADLVIADNLYMYGDPNGAVITESSPQQPTTKKGRLRKAMAEEALEAHRSGRLRVAISRASTYFGPGHDQSSEAIFAAALRGKPMRVFGNVDAPHTFSFVPDAAHAMVALGSSERAWGRAWIAPVQPAITQADFAGRVWAAAGRSTPPRLQVVGRRTLRALGIIVPVIRELPEMLYEYEKPFMANSSRFEAEFGFGPTSSADAIARTVAWYADREPARA